MRKLTSFFQHYGFKRILDVGTGNGNFIKIMTTMTDSYEEIIGIDDLDIAINTSNKNFQDERIKFMRMDGYNMEFEDDTFDLVVLSNTLHHLEDVEGMIKEMERVCKKDGFVLINEMMNNGLTKRQKSHMMIHHFAAEVDRLTGEIHNETMKDVEILKLLQSVASRDIKDVWPLEFERPTENSQEEIEWLMETIDRLLERVEGHEEYQNLLKKGKKIKKHIMKNGFDSATQLLVVMK